MRDGIKVAAKETILTPRFYTTDFDEMEKLFSLEMNPNLPMVELDVSNSIASVDEVEHRPTSGRI